MQMILSPAKKMIQDNDDYVHESLPHFLNQTEELLSWLKAYDTATLKKIWKCNDKLVALNQERIETMNLHKQLTPALFAYEGLAFQHIAAGALEDDALDFLKTRLWILSGFYGALRPMDGVRPYRLEMQAILPDHGDLYSYWNDTLCHHITKDDHVIVNLASAEYSKAIEPYLTDEDTYITCVFAEEREGKLIQKGTMAKIARGEMVSYIAENQIDDVEDLKAFDRNYLFSKEYSDDNHYVFLYQPQ